MPSVSLRALQDASVSYADRRSNYEKQSIGHWKHRVCSRLALVMQCVADLILAFHGIRVEVYTGLNTPVKAGLPCIDSSSKFDRHFATLPRRPKHLLRDSGSSRNVFLPFLKARELCKNMSTHGRRWEGTELTTVGNATHPFPPLPTCASPSKIDTD